MFFEPRFSIKNLAPLCRRMSTQLAAGVDVRRAWQREAEIAQSTNRRPLRKISAAIDRGDSMAEAINATGEFFPALFRELVDVGEQGGQTAEVFRQLGGHYDHLLELRRNFRSAITWPVIQFSFALTVVGLLIWVMGLLAGKDGKPAFDMLGLGLYGTSGLIKYCTFLGCIAAAAGFMWYAVRKGVLWTRPLQSLLMRTPKLGHALETLSMSRLCWSLYVTFESGMDLRRALDLALRSTRNFQYSSQFDAIWQSIRGGNTLHEALEGTRVFPREFLDSIEVGERSGRMSQTLSLLSEQYQEEARLALKMLTQIAGFAVWVLVAILVVSLIFRIVNQYLNLLNSFM
jgi:type II secretory pathway component PulF